MEKFFSPLLMESATIAEKEATWQINAQIATAIMPTKACFKKMSEL
jgi:hypothetical protein